MKKILLLALVSLLTIGVQAQAIKKVSISADKSAVAFEMPKQSARAAELGSNQYLCGYYTTDDLAEYGSGMGRYTSGVCKVANPLDNSVLKKFEGFKVVGMRVGLCAAVQSDFGAYIGKLVDGEIQDVVTKVVGTGAKGWNTIMFTEKEQQFTLTSDASLLVGFQYNQVSGSTDACYPISYYTGSGYSSPFLFYGNIPSSYGGSGLDWYNLDDSGVLSVQLIVEGQLPSENTIVERVDINGYIQKGQQAEASVRVTNMGQNAITSMAFNYYIDNVLTGNTEVQVTNLGSTQTKEVGLSIPVAATLASGKHTLKVECTQVNGAASTSQALTAENEFIAYSDKVARQKHLIEHFTSWTCTYCHLGYKMLRKLEQSNDQVAWVALHGNQSSSQDPYYLTEVDEVMSYLGANSFPSGCFNRMYQAMLADGNGIVYGLGYNEQYADQVAQMITDMLNATESPSFVTLAITSDYDSDSRRARITVTGKGVADAAKLLAGQKLYIYITEAGLTGRQYSNGSWESNFEHNNTLRAVPTTTTGADITWNGDNFSYTASYSVPSDSKAENLSITAFVAPAPSSDLLAMGVNNCERAALNTTSTQTPQYYVFADKDGNVYDDGATITCSTVEDDGLGSVMIPSGLYVKNVSAGSNFTVSAQADITQIDNGILQLCFPQNCDSYSTAGQQNETAKGTIAQGEVKNLMTEWLPTAYGACTVTYTLRTYQTIIKKAERTITVNYRYNDPAGISTAEGDHAAPRCYYNMQGNQSATAHKGLNIIRMSDGSVRKVVVK